MDNHQLHEGGVIVEQASVVFTSDTPIPQATTSYNMPATPEPVQNIEQNRISDSEDQTTESQVVQESNPDPLLLFECLKKGDYKDFETRGLENAPPCINYVFPEKDKTVLDIACAKNFEKFVEIMLKFGAEAGNSGESNTPETQSKIEPNLKVKGWTALYLAVSNMNQKCVEILLKKNADPTIADSTGLTPLHVAVMTNQDNIVSLLTMTKDVTEYPKSIPGVNVRCADNEGNTPLHYAAHARSSQMVRMLLEAGSYIGHKNICGIPPIAYITPETMLRYLDKCLQLNDEFSDNFDKYEIEFNYQCLAPHVENNAKNKKELDHKSVVLHVEDNEKDKEELYDTALTPQDEDNERDKKKPSRKCLYSLGITNNICMEMQPVLYIAESKTHRHLLKHPILSSFIHLKWQRLSPILWTNLIFYFIFYSLLNSYIWSMTYFTDGVQPNGVNTTLNESIDNDTSQSLTTGWNPTNVLRYSTTFALVILVLREIVQLILSPRYYFRNFENWFELLLICFSIALLVGAGTWVCALTILLSTCELIRSIGQCPQGSTSIEMFKTVTKRFLFLYYLYTPLMFAFALAFYKLFKDGDKSSFPDPFHSLFKTVIMLTGEFDTDGIPFVNHPILSRLVFVLFVFLIAIVLLNLLNGLAISDTNEILSEAKLRGLIAKTELVAYAESIFFRSPETVKNKWWIHLNKFIHLDKFIYWNNSLLFLSKNKSPVSDVSPIPKIQVRPQQNNAILCRGREIINDMKLTMDDQIITHAKNIISRDGRVSDNWKILNTIDIFSKDVDKRLKKIEKLICNFNQPEKENSNNDNYKSD